MEKMELFDTKKLEGLLEKGGFYKVFPSSSQIFNNHNLKVKVFGTPYFLMLSKKDYTDSDSVLVFDEGSFTYKDDVKVLPIEKLPIDFSFKENLTLLDVTPVSLLDYIKDFMKNRELKFVKKDMDRCIYINSDMDFKGIKNAFFGVINALAMKYFLSSFSKKELNDFKVYRQDVYDSEGNAISLHYLMITNGDYTFITVLN